MLDFIITELVKNSPVAFTILAFFVICITYIFVYMFILSIIHKFNKLVIIFISKDKPVCLHCGNGMVGDLDET